MESTLPPTRKKEEVNSIYLCKIMGNTLKAKISHVSYMAGNITSKQIVADILVAT